MVNTRCGRGLVVILWVALPAAAGEPVVTVAPGLRAATPAAQVAQTVLERLSRHPIEGARMAGPNGELQTTPPTPEILSMTLVDGEDLASALPPDRGAPSFPGQRIWVVSARGRFAWKQFEHTSGYYYVDDETGEVLGFGGPARDANGDPR